jgi:hypothetical protein
MSINGLVDTRAADTNTRRSYRPRRSNADTIKVETCQQLPIEKSPLAGRAFMAVTATTPAVMVRARRPSNSEQYEHDTKPSAIATGKTEGGCANSSRRQNTEKNLSQINTVLLDN